MLFLSRVGLYYPTGFAVASKTNFWRRHVYLSGNPAADRALIAVTGGRIESWFKKYENLVGLTDVKEAQDKVMQAEVAFQKAQADRRQLQHQMTTFHGKLKELHAALDKVQRGEERYLALLTEEYEILREEKRVSSALNESERAERDGFTALSSAVRESHERERLRAERTKYWSIFGSVIGAAIGIIGSSVNNYRRNQELRSLVRDSAAGGVEVSKSIAELVSVTQQQQNEMRAHFSTASSASGDPVATMPVTAVKDIIALIHAGNDALDKQFIDVKRMIAATSIPSSGFDSSGSSVVYVGPEMNEILERTEKNVVRAMKRDVLLSSTGLYISCLVTAGIVYSIMRTLG